MEKRYDIVNVLDICVDLIITGTDVEPEFGQKEKLVDGYFLELGGSGGIFSSQAAKLGLRVAGIGVTGEDMMGRLVRTELEKSGVDITYLRSAQQEKTGLGILLCKPDDRAILTYNGTILGTAPTDVTDEILKQARHLHISSYYLLNQLRSSWTRIAQRAHQFGATVSLDTNWDPEEKWGAEIWELLEYVDVFLPNEQEALHISGKESLDEAVRFLGNKVSVLAVKMGAKGACAVHEGIVYRENAVGMRAADAVGAGDNFDAGFLWAYLRGLDIQTCLGTGCLCGTASTREHGGVKGQMTEKELLPYL